MVAIRDLAETDRAPWDRLWAGYLEFYETTLPSEITDCVFARLIDPNTKMFAFVAEDRGRLAGFVHCVLHPATWSLADYCYLEDLFVSPYARGAGVARALIEAVYARADALGCARVYWLTHENNATARKLYDRVAQYRGFIQYRR